MMDANDEYQIPEASASPVYQTEPERDSNEAISPSAMQPENSKARKIIILAIVVVLAWACYKFFESRHNAANKRRAQQAAAAAAAKSVPMQAPAMMQAPLAPVAPVAVPSPSDARLSALEAGNTDTRMRLERTDATLNDMQNALSTMSAQITQLTNSVQNLSSQVSQQQQSIQVLTTPPAKKVPQTVIRKPKFVPYFVQALIPGRAWLISDKGDTITVRLGDSIPGYGVVDVIDPSAGVITTSTGKTIQFKSDES